MFQKYKVNMKKIVLSFFLLAIITLITTHTTQAAQDATINITTVLQLDCYDKAGTSGDHDVNLGLVIAGTPIVGESTCAVSTNDESGYYLSVVNDNPATDTLTHDSHEIPDLTSWNETTKVTENWTVATKGLGFSVIEFPQDPITHNVFDGVWNNTNQCPGGTGADTNEYAGIPITSQAITAVTEYVSAPTITDICYKIDVSPSQPSGVYIGSVTYTATSDASSYYQ